MGFYIRKALMTGPVRLNLSKGGLGLSLGVTGARVGLNRQGVYVHGGREGLYYRKYVKRRKGGAGAGHATAGPGAQNDGPVYHFKDTGSTLAKPSQGSGVAENVKKSAQAIQKEVRLAEDPFSSGKLLLMLLIISLLSVSVLVFASVWMILLSVFGLILIAGHTLYQINWKHKMKKQFQVLISRLEETGEWIVGEADERVAEGRNEESGLIPANAPHRWQVYLAYRLHAVGSEMAVRREEIPTGETLAQLKRLVPLDSQLVDALRMELLAGVLEEMLEDHFLSEEESKAMTQLIEAVQLPDEKVRPVVRILDVYNTLRHDMERPLQETNPGIPLVQGEKAYEVFEKVRILNERVMDRFQRNGVQHRVIGFDIDLEGKLVLTDRRMIFVGKGAREYRLNRLLDITLDPEGGIIELTLSKRKNPVILTTEQLMLLSARLERIHQHVLQQAAP